MLDVVYVMHIDLIEERARTERLATTFALVMGAEITPTDVAQMREDYDTFLKSETAKPLTPQDTERLELMQALGIAK